MRYDRSFRSGGWETRMPEGGRGWNHGYPEPGRGGDAADRPWVGGYREGYQGGSGGYAMGTSGPLYESYGARPGRDDHERGYRRPRGQQGRGRRPGTYFVRARAGDAGGAAAADGARHGLVEREAHDRRFGSRQLRTGGRRHRAQREREERRPGHAAERQPTEPAGRRGERGVAGRVAGRVCHAAFGASALPAVAVMRCVPLRRRPAAARAADRG